MDCSPQHLFNCGWVVYDGGGAWILNNALFSPQDDDVRKYVNTYRRTFESKNGKKHSKAPKIQR